MKRWRCARRADPFTAPDGSSRFLPKKRDTMDPAGSATVASGGIFLFSVRFRTVSGALGGPVVAMLWLANRRHQPANPPGRGGRGGEGGNCPGHRRGQVSPEPTASPPFLSTGEEAAKLRPLAPSATGRRGRGSNRPGGGHPEEVSVDTSAGSPASGGDGGPMKISATVSFLHRHLERN